MQGRKTAKGSKNRIENRSHHYHPQKRKGGGVLVCLIPLGVGQSWQGDFLYLARNFSWIYGLCRGGKPQRGRRIALKIDHTIIIICEHSALKAVMWEIRGDYAWLNPLGAEQPWQGDSF
jgi:hypothetical protein